MTNPLYSDILEAPQADERCGRYAEKHKAKEFISQREAFKTFGKAIVNEYYKRYGHADRTGGAENSKKLLSSIKLNELKEAKNMMKGIVRFECKIVKREKLLKQA